MKAQIRSENPDLQIEPWTKTIVGKGKNCDVG